MTHLESLGVEVHVPHLDPMQTYRCFVVPDLLIRWWPEQAETDPQFGGNYHLAWVEPNWHLRGTYIQTEPGRALAFTWQWDHEPEIDRRVDIGFSADAQGGTRVAVRHTYVSEDEGKGYREGWEHFLGCLASIESF